MDQKSQSPWNRDVVKKRALAAQSLDAVFIVMHYNSEHRGYPKQDAIDLDKLFIGIANDDLDKLRRRVNSLLADEAYFGEKHWTGTKDHQEIIEEMIQHHPGFSMETYEEVLHTGIRHGR